MMLARFSPRSPGAAAALLRAPIAAGAARPTLPSVPSLAPAPAQAQALTQRGFTSDSASRHAVPTKLATPPEPEAAALASAAGLTSSLPARREWSREEVDALYNGPLLDLVFQAATVHRTHHDPNSMQLCTLMNIKEGGCSEDCSYCSQSSKYDTSSGATPLSDVESVLAEARKAKANGSTRFCMGAAWREVGGRKRGFNRILDMVRGIREMDMEVCTTLGMLTPEQAAQLKDAGLTAYNHNLDTSREYYSKVVSTRTYDDRIRTISNARDAGISVCSGGILGLGEEKEDRVGLIWEMSRLPEPPESFPVNALVAIPGTPMAGNKPTDFQTMLRTISTARVVLPTSIIRLAAGRHMYTESEQAFAFMAGANAIFTGERMLTTPTSSWDVDKAMLARWGMRGMGSFEEKVMQPHGTHTPQQPETHSADAGTGGGCGCASKRAQDGVHITEQPGLGLKPDQAGVADTA